MKHKQLTHSSPWQYVKSSTRCNSLIRETKTPCLVVIVLQKVSLLLCASALRFLGNQTSNEHFKAKSSASWTPCHLIRPNWLVITVCLAESQQLFPHQASIRLNSHSTIICVMITVLKVEKKNSTTAIDCCPAIKDTCWIWASSRKAPSHRQVAAVLWGTCPLVGCDRQSNTAGKMQRLLEPNLNPMNTQ